MSVLALGLDFLWKFIEPILSDSIKERLKPQESSEIAKKRSYALYKTLNEVKNKTDAFVSALKSYLEGVTASAELWRERLNSLRKTAKDLMEALPILVDALDKINPQLEIHRKKIVEEILAYRRSRALVLSELEQSVSSANNADPATLRKLLKRAEMQPVHPGRTRLSF